VVRGQLRAGVLVDGDHRDLAAVPGLDGDDRQSRPQVAQPARGTLARCDDDDAVDGLAGQRLDR
jgi:hypothetical protein